MSNVTADFSLGYTAGTAIPDHLPLICLISYLFLETTDPEERDVQLRDIFYYKYGNLSGLQLQLANIQQNQIQMEWLAAAEQAANSNEIEQYDKDYDFESYERDKQKIPEFYSVNFVVWAEQHGFPISQSLAKEIKPKIERFIIGRNSRAALSTSFPAITQQDFNKLINEPLWNMTDALLYVLGYKSEKDKDTKVGFLRYKSRAKRLMNYILDAKHTGDLALYNVDSTFLDNSPSDGEEHLNAFYSSRVKPKDLVTLLKSLSLDIPMIGQYVNPVEQIADMIEPPSQNVDLENLLHPIIVKSSYQHYKDGHLRDAVFNSIVAVFDFIREKTGLSLDGENLISQAFSLTDPYIVLSELTSESGKSDQKGFIQIFKGTYLGIRNPKAHSLVHDLTKQKAAQYLIFASLLARRIDEATFPKTAQTPNEKSPT